MKFTRTKTGHFFILGIFCHCGCEVEPPRVDPPVKPLVSVREPDPAMKPEQVENFKRSQSDPDRPANLSKKMDLSRLPWSIELQQQKFAYEHVGRQLLKIDRAAREMAEARKLPALEKYLYQQDSGTPGFKDYYRTYRADWDFSSLPVHLLRIETWLCEDDAKARSYSLEATWRPNSGWGVAWQYRPNLANDAVAFVLVFHHPTLAPYRTPGLPLSPSSQEFTVDQQGRWSQERILTIRSSNPELHNQGHDAFLSERKKRLPRYWDSPESFRDVALEELGFYEVQVQKWEADGARVAFWGGGTSGGDPPHIAGFHSAGPAQRKTILQDAMQQAADRRKLVNEHYQEMHRALLNSLPAMREMLLEELETEKQY